MYSDFPNVSLNVCLRLCLVALCVTHLALFPAMFLHYSFWNLKDRRISSKYQQFSSEVCKNSTWTKGRTEFSRLRLKFSNYFYLCSQFFLIAIVLAIFSVLVNGQDINSRSHFNKDLGNGSHWINCTIDGQTHFNEDCVGWLGKFLTWVGLGLFVILFLLCGCLWYCVCTVCRICCCSERPREVIYTTYVYPTSYSQIPWKLSDANECVIIQNMSYW